MQYDINTRSNICFKEGDISLCKKRRFVKKLLYLILIAFWLIPSLAYAARINIVGFEQGYVATNDTVGSEVGTPSGTMSIVSSPVLHGSYALRTNPTTTATGYAEIGGSIDGSNFASAATVYWRFYFRFATAPSSGDEPIFAAMAAPVGTYKWEVRLTSDRKLAVYDNTPAVVATGTTVLSADTWYRVEVKSGTGASGAYEVKIDGTSELSGTANLGSANNVRARFGKWINRNGNTVDFFYDSLVADDADYPGESSIVAMNIDGNGADTNWTIDSGTGEKWEQLDEVPSDGTTTDLISQAQNDAYTATFESASSAGISGTISSVKVIGALARIGSNGTVLMRIKSGGTNSDSTTINTVSFYRYYGHLLETDPNGGGAWTTSDLDGLEGGVVDTNASIRANISALMAIVEFVPATDPVFTQNHYKWFYNTDDITPSGILAAEDTAGDILTTQPVRLRVNITVSGNNLSAGAQAFKLKYATSLSGPWTDVGVSTSFEEWRFYENPSVAHGTTLASNVLTGSDVLGSYMASNSMPTNPNQVNTTQDIEYDFSLNPTRAYPGRTYYFRVFERDDTPLAGFNYNPQANVSTIFYTTQGGLNPSPGGSSGGGTPQTGGIIQSGSGDVSPGGDSGGGTPQTGGGSSGGSSGGDSPIIIDWFWWLSSHSP